MLLHCDEGFARAGEPQGNVAHHGLSGGDLLGELEDQKRVDEGDQHGVAGVEEDLDGIDVDVTALVEVVVSVHDRIADRGVVLVLLLIGEQFEADHLPDEQARCAGSGLSSRLSLTSLSVCPSRGWEGAAAASAAMIASRIARRIASQGSSASNAAPPPRATTPAMVTPMTPPLLAMKSSTSWATSVSTPTRKMT